MKTCADNHYGTPKPPKQPMPSSATVVDGEPTFHRSGSVGNIVVPGQHPSSDGKRQRNRSNVETRSADVDNKVQRLMINQLCQVIVMLLLAEDEYHSIANVYGGSWW